ncbi:hypothetical protein [Ascidiimonas aurantiaca]|uniref:hypothetical protein n=1 Tax=Ascidiimonas aurantiaca TaxID=1685432 RepID=UPI0030EB7528
MKKRFKHIVSIFFLGLFLSIQVAASHGFSHMIDDHTSLEHCFDCEYAVQNSLTPALGSEIPVIKVPFNLNVAVQKQIFYQTPFCVSNISFSFLNKAPPSFT